MLLKMQPNYIRYFKNKLSVNILIKIKTPPTIMCMLALYKEHDIMTHMP